MSRPVRFPEAALVIMAKAPEPGSVKTRLIPRLGADAAARLCAELLERVAARLVAAHSCPVQLWCSPDTRHPLFTRLEGLGIQLRQQQGSDLGARMEWAAGQALEGADHVVIVGADCPLLDSRLIETAIEALAEGGDTDAVLGPAEDGGYYLLGLNRVSSGLFREIPWGSETVLDITRRRLAAIGWRWLELETLWDVDRPEDLLRLERALARSPWGRSWKPFAWMGDSA